MSGNRLKLVLAFLAVYIIWGSTYLAIRFAIETLPPFLMAGVRFLVAGSVLYWWARRRGAPAPQRINWKAAALLAVLLLIGGNGGVVWAEQRVPSGLAALLIATEPFWIVMLDWLRPGGSRPSLAVSAGLVFGFIGVALLVSPFDLAGGGAVDPIGAAVVILASLSWAAGSLWTARGAPLPRSPALATGMEMLVGGALFILIGTAAGEWSGVSLASMSLKSVLALLYLTVFGAIVGFTAYVYLLQHTTPSKASTYAYVNPVIAVFLGWALAGEAINGRVALAALAIVTAVVMITRHHAQPSANRKAESERIPDSGIRDSQHASQPPIRTPHSDLRTPRSKTAPRA
jgi:drug/metabolite transporter (DMT)-like permease